MKPLISIVLPGIRSQNWIKLYESIKKATTHSFELIIVGPTEMSNRPGNVKLFQDFGSPVRASNIAATLAEGDMITWAADDGVYLEHSLDHMIDQLSGNWQSVVVGKYYEGKEKTLHDNAYYKVNGAPCTASKHIPDLYWIFNVALMWRTFFDYMGGWDNRFETCPMAHTDLAVRSQADGALVTMLDEAILDCEHMPGETGDHGPVHRAQIFRDEPLFQKIYGDPKWKLNLKRDITQWKNYPCVWQERFQTK